MVFGMTFFPASPDSEGVPVYQVSVLWWCQSAKPVGHGNQDCQGKRMGGLTRPWICQPAWHIDMGPVFVSLGSSWFILLFSFFFFLAAQDLSCGQWDLVPWPGIKPRPPELGAQSLNRWIMRKVPTPDPYSLSQCHHYHLIYLPIGFLLS